MSPSPPTELKKRVDTKNATKTENGTKNAPSIDNPVVAGRPTKSGNNRRPDVKKEAAQRVPQSGIMVDSSTWYKGVLHGIPKKYSAQELRADIEDIYGIALATDPVPLRSASTDNPEKTAYSAIIAVKDHQLLAAFKKEIMYVNRKGRLKDFYPPSEYSRRKRASEKCATIEKEHTEQRATIEDEYAKKRATKEKEYAKQRATIEDEYAKQLKALVAKYQSDY